MWVVECLSISFRFLRICDKLVAEFCPCCWSVIGDTTVTIQLQCIFMNKLLPIVVVDQQNLLIAPVWLQFSTNTVKMAWHMDSPCCRLL